MGRRCPINKSMLLYAIIILICIAFITALNILLPGPLAAQGVLAPLLAVTLSTVAVIAVDGLLAFLIRRLPERWFTRGKRIFTVSRRECHFYRALGVRQWKDKIPELGMFTGFHKNRVYRPQDNTYVARFILECNYGAVIHLVGALLGFLIIFIYPLAFAPWVGIPVAFVNLVLNLLPFFALRYNTPKLEALYTINARREKKTACL